MWLLSPQFPNPGVCCCWRPVLLLWLTGGVLPGSAFSASALVVFPLNHNLNRLLAVPLPSPPDRQEPDTSVRSCVVHTGIEGEVLPAPDTRHRTLDHC